MSATVNDVAAWGEQSRIFPISRAWTTSNLHAGQFTAACGVYVYRGDLLPAEFKGNVFTCDPTGNLIHREIMQPAGPTFTSKPAYEGKEFLASADEWFRPVNMELGPDGALYVVDMYRCVIEHPDFVPDELKRRPDLRLGDDRGRIWRIVPSNTSPKRERGTRRPELSKLSSEHLVPILEHPNAWQRETAQRLLLASGTAQVGKRLQDLIANSKAPQARAHALSILPGDASTKEPILIAALQDPDERVRRQAILTLEVSSQAHQASNDISNLTRDPSALVRFQARLSAKAVRSGLVLASLEEDAEDPWLRRSLLLSINRGAGRFLAINWLNAGRSHAKFSEGTLTLIEDLSELAAANDTERMSAGLGYKALMNIAQPEVGLAALRGAAKIWARKKVPDELRQSLVPVEKLQHIAGDSDQSLTNRTTAVSLLAFGSSPAEILLRFIVPDQQQPIRIAAVAALARQPGNEHWQPLLDGFATETPPIRRAIIDALLASADRTKLLLDAIEAGQIKPSEIDLAQVKRLTTHRDSAIKARAEKLFAAATPADRAKALADYQPVLAMKGDAKSGQAIFDKNCSACHRIAGIGTTVAPDISDSRTKKFDQLLADILQPNRAIDNNYIGYSVRTLDGVVLTGILTAETATSITLRQQGGKDSVIPRSEIDELRSSGQSLMPEGLERNIPPQDMADLLAFIKNWRYLDGRTPLSQ